MPTSYNIIVSQGQTLFDIAMEYLGNAAHAMELAVENNIELTGELNTGDVIVIPAKELTSAEEKVIQYFAKKKIKPAGALPV